VLVDVHLAGFAPAFTLSFHDSEYARKPPVPIASGVRCERKKKERATPQNESEVTKYLLEVQFIYSNSILINYFPYLS